MMEIQHFKMSNDLMLFGVNSVLKPIRKANIKFYGRLNRVAEKYNLSVDELYTVWCHCVGSMGSKEFFRLFVQDEKFRVTMIDRVLHDKDV
jgi:hypothetical protein